jgi:hypothetical protein
MKRRSRWCGRCVLQETNDATCRWLPRGGSAKKAWFLKKEVESGFSKTVKIAWY